MYINIEKLKSYGYEVDIDENIDGEPKGIAINGNGPSLHEPIAERLIDAYPEVSSDILRGLAYECTAAAQAQDIIRICSKS